MDVVDFITDMVNFMEVCTTYEQIQTRINSLFNCVFKGRNSCLECEGNPSCINREDVRHPDVQFITGGSVCGVEQVII